ncbi:MAG: hypothetical protein ABI680_09335 [Chthoniobacteraceae bacterium]
MKNGNEVVARVIAAFDSLGIDYMLAGSYSSNYYGIPRATRDADFVAILNGRTRQLAAALGEGFLVDPQPSFEVVTGTTREMISVPSLSFDVEVFELSGDAHDQTRFERRRPVFDEIVGGKIFLPTAEDVIITKIRWAKLARREKDTDDVRNIIAVQGDDAFDWDYIHQWCALHETRRLLDEIRASIPPLD